MIHVLAAERVSDALSHIGAAEALKQQKPTKMLVRLAALADRRRAIERVLATQRRRPAAVLRGGQ